MMKLVGTISVVTLVFLSLACGNMPGQGRSDSRVTVAIVTDEADAVLSILAKKQADQEITEADWKRVFSSEGYVRLKKREVAIKRPFEDAEFKTFVLSDALFFRRAALVDTLDEWKKTDVDRVARLPLAYLPPNGANTCEDLSRHKAA